jgi:hypothetical protein
MTGPQHYAEAERLIAFGREKGDSHRSVRSSADPSPADLQSILADAQIHATLALAAATALGTSPPRPGRGPTPPGPSTGTGSSLGQRSSAAGPSSPWPGSAISMKCSGSSRSPEC